MKLLLLSCIYLIYLQAVLARRSDDQTLNFLVLGDWGGQPDPPYTTEAETSIAAVMGSVAASENSQFTLALGDNFYNTGVKNVNDPRFNYTFEVGRELISSNNSPTLLLILIFIHFLECVYGRVPPDSLVYCLWQPRSLRQLFSTDCLH